MWFSFCCAVDENWKFKREKIHLVNNLNEWILIQYLIWWLLNLSSLCHTVYKCHLIYLPIRFNLKICLSLTWLLFVQRDLKTQNGMCDYLLLTQLNNKKSKKRTRPFMQKYIPVSFVCLFERMQIQLRLSLRFNCIKFSQQSHICIICIIVVTVNIQSL